MLDEAIKVKNLRKTYGNFEAVKGINLSLVPGKVNALLGPNGAGKTTTLKSILGLVHYSGEITILGETIDVARERISFVPEDKSFYDSLTPEKAIKMCSMLMSNFSGDKAAKQMKKFDLPMNKKISAFSHGMKTSTYLAIAMSQDADIFIFDEPTWGLDPLRRDEVLEMISALSESGKTVLYTSHIIPEVEKIADVFSIMYKGVILYTGEMKGLDDRFVLYSLPLKTVIDKNDFTAVVKEANVLKVLTDNPKEIARLKEIEGSKREEVNLESFFGTIVRGNKHVL
ncbi:MAG: ABC transporter ATP-binding protein [Mesotoga sp.]|jgi:ABC-2 type transport system ATP-binding protein|uniref:ABC transporter ATP-binding protein n=1 Tax=Mesotoga TaxID=1184396 RepID=UPI0002C8F063|nr:ABC transporter ATP-binding protein [Mesotoga sp.]MCP5461517.1 ABC transporter ATP-binding protein [Thermotogota bacterium]CCU85428.1 ABC transporter related protein [Mesotoga infera]